MQCIIELGNHRWAAKQDGLVGHAMCSAKINTWHGSGCPQTDGQTSSFNFQVHDTDRHLAGRGRTNGDYHGNSIRFLRWVVCDLFTAQKMDVMRWAFRHLASYLCLHSSVSQSPRFTGKLYSIRFESMVVAGVPLPLLLGSLVFLSF